MSESRESSEGGYIAVRTDKDTPVTKLKLHKLEGMAGAQFKLVFSSNKIKLWKQLSEGVFSEAVTTNSTTFPANQDTEIFVEGVTKSDASKDVEVGLKVVIGSTESSSVPVKLTVVEAEFKIQLKMWIKEQWIDVPWHPLNNFLDDNIAEKRGQFSPIDITALWIIMVATRVSRYCGEVAGRSGIQKLAKRIEMAIGEN